MPLTGTNLKTTRRLLIERRTSLRFPCNLQALCRAGGETGMAWPAQVRNISAKGAGLVMGREFSPGTRFTVHFLRGPGQTYVAHMQVIHCLAEGEGWYHGCAFLRRISQDVVDTLAQ
jgi:hypothetical protein